MQTGPETICRPSKGVEKSVAQAVPKQAWSWPQWMCVVIPLWYFVLGLTSAPPEVPIPYFVTEWMTTYSGGFVRRGLLGQIFLTGSDLSHIPPMDLIRGVRIVLAITFLTALAFGVHRNARNLGLLGSLTVLLSPLVAICAWTDLGSIDLVFLLFCAMNAWMASRLDEEAYFRSALVWVGVIGVFVSLCHEGFLLLCLPLNVIISFRKLGVKSWPKTIAIYAAPLAACVVAMKFNGSVAQADAISRAWLAHGVDLPQNSAIGYLGQTIPKEIVFIRQYETVGNIVRCLGAFVLCLASMSLLFKWLPFAESRKRVLRDYFLIPVLFTLPLYLIGSDWHRWVQIPFGSGILALLYSNLLQEKFEVSRRQFSLLVAAVFVGVCIKPAAPYFDPRSLLRSSLFTTIVRVGQYTGLSNLTERFLPQNRLPVR